MTIRPIQPGDYAEVEQLIRNAILQTVANDYSKPAIDIMLASDPTQPHETREEREYFVAEDDGIRGIIGRKDNMVKTFFVDPTYHGQGVETSLLAHVEHLMQNDGYSKSTSHSTITAKSFYEKQGYTVTSKEIKTIGDAVLTKYAMEKDLTKHSTH